MTIPALRAYRHKHKLTQKALAALLGVTHVAVCRWETGERRPRLAEANRIADITGIPVGLLLGVPAEHLRLTRQQAGLVRRRTQ